MIRFRSYALIMLAVFFQSLHGLAQNLEKVGTKEAIKITGGLGFNAIAYHSSGLNFPSREPFTWYATGNLNISILDVALPFSYTYSNQGGKFTQPFNRTAINPHYKWVKSTIGITSMSFSPYTLSGYLFLGAGVELTPGKWKISLMAGRLNKAVEYDAGDDNLNEIVYRRFGYGFKCGYENKGFGGNIIVFKAHDNVESLPFVPLNTTVKPQDNLVISVGGRATITKSLFAESEYAISTLTQNRHDLGMTGANGPLNSFVAANSTTDFFQAYKGSIKYQLKWMSIGVNYEHIDPGYRTLGGYYFNNDLNNITLSPAFSLLDKKLNVAFNSGFQRNNLAEDKSATTKRWVGSVNVSYTPIPQIFFNGSYSNFSVFTRNRPASDPFYVGFADTMNFYQLTQNASAMISWQFGKSDKKNALQAFYNFQESINLTGNIQTAGAFGTGLESLPAGIPMNIHIGNFSYTKTFKAIQASATAGVNLNKTISIAGVNTFMGPSVLFQKGLFDKKARLGLGSTYNRQYQNDALFGNVFNHRVSFTYSPKFEREKVGRMNLGVNANWMQKLSQSSAMTDVQEVNVFVNLSYSF